MGKRLIISESEKNLILNMHESYKAKGVISEQDDSPNHEFIRGVQRFLNEKLKPSPNLKVDGLTDNNLKSATAQAISKYQSMIGVYPADGVWGENTWGKMSPQDKQRCKDLVAEEGGLIDRFLNWIGL